MNPRYRDQLTLIAALTLQILVLLTISGCSDRDLTSLEEATADVDPVVFSDGFGNSLDYSAFEFSYYEALTIDETESFTGTASLKVDVPGGNWAGGAFWTHSARDLSSFNALTFYARASVALDLNSCGLGLDVNGTSPYKVEIVNTPLTTSWTQVVIPIPFAERLISERGMFWYSEGEGGAAVSVWFDEVEFAYVETITNPRPELSTGSNDTVDALIGEVVPITGTFTTFAVNGEDLELVHEPNYFTYYSSDESVAVTENGIVTVVGGGIATITAKLDTTDAAGELNIKVAAPPESPAPTPSFAEADVISIFSDIYDDIPVDSWMAEWSNASGVFDQQISGDNVKVYTGLDSPHRFASIDFQSNLIDAETAGMTHFHVDIWAPTGTLFYIELVDFGPNGVYDAAGDDTKKKLLFYPLTDPPFIAGEWSAMEIPLSEFTDMNFGNLAQFNIQTGDGSIVYVDNIYFHK